MGFLTVKLDIVVLLQKKDIVVLSLYLDIIIFNTIAGYRRFIKIKSNKNAILA